MKNIIKILLVLVLCAVLWLVLTSCSNSSSTEEYTTPSSKQSITFAIDGLHTTRAALVDDNDNVMTDLFVYDNGTEVLHQVNTESNFGVVTLELNYGSHNLSFIATKANNPSISNSVFSCDKILPTYAYSCNLDVNSKTGKQSIVLNRIYGTLKFLIDDEIPSNAASMIITVSSYCKALNISTFNGTVSEYENTIDISKKVGKSEVSWNIYFIAPVYNTPFTSTIHINIVDADSNTIVSHTVEAELKTNRVTTIYGNYFGNNIGQSISLNTTWDDPTDVQL